MPDVYTQFKPARAKVSIKIADLGQGDVTGRFAEQKIDGQRFVIQTDRRSRCGLFKHGATSRRISTVTDRYVEKHDRVPHIANHPALPPNSMLDNEFVSAGDVIVKELPGKFWDKLMQPQHPHMVWLRKKFEGGLPTYPHVGNTTSIMGSLPAEAVAKQEERGLIWAYAFDILQWSGRNLTGNPQRARREFLAAQLAPANPEDGVILMPAWHHLTLDETHELFNIITSKDPETKERGEGLILKLYDDKYNGAKAWAKVKKDFEADVVLTGDFEWGKEGVTGKMEGLVGNLFIGVYHGGELHTIGKISAIMDDEARLPMLTEMAEAGELRDIVVTVHFNKLQVSDKTSIGYTMQHPRYGGVGGIYWTRDDKNATDCTLDALKEIVK